MGVLLGEELGRSPSPFLLGFDSVKIRPFALEQFFQFLVRNFLYSATLLQKLANLVVVWLELHA